MPPSRIVNALDNRFEVRNWRNGLAILEAVHPEATDQIIDVLSRFNLYRSYITKPGGRKSQIAQWLDNELSVYGWREKKFDTRIHVDEVEYVSPTHSVDCFKERIALEVEWNNKDPFYDRDLNNFRLLYDLRVIDVGIILTRCDELQDVVDRLGRGDSFGSSTTHMSKLLPRIEGGGGGGCPLIVFGIRSSCYVDQDVPILEPSKARKRKKQ
ncbi:MAG: restriction endonuclease [Alphaproteobacteria bacterium]|nr:restriction endonuclease [Alphaproteobacteria bacterium]